MLYLLFMTSLTIAHHLYDNFFTRTVGTYVHGFVPIAAFLNTFPIRMEVAAVTLESLDDKKGMIPHYSPHYTSHPRGKVLEDMLGEVSFSIGMLSAAFLEGGGLYYTYSKLTEGEWLQAALYPAAKVVTNGLAWLGRKKVQKKLCELEL